MASSNSSISRGAVRSVRRRVSRSKPGVVAAAGALVNSAGPEEVPMLQQPLVASVDSSLTIPSVLQWPPSTPEWPRRTLKLRETQRACRRGPHDALRPTTSEREVPAVEKAKAPVVRRVYLPVRLWNDLQCLMELLLALRPREYASFDGRFPGRSGAPNGKPHFDTGAASTLITPMTLPLWSCLSSEKLLPRAVRTAHSRR
eukprot:ctg_3233.g553